MWKAWNITSARPPCAPSRRSPTSFNGTRRSSPKYAKISMKIEKTAFGGWANCLRLANDHAELIITLDVGPRIISYQHLPGGKNVLKTNADELGKSGEEAFVMRGGHRLWLAPESERS